MTEQKEKIDSSMALIDRAEAAAKRIEAGVELMRTENDRLEKIRTTEILGGSSEAGKVPEKPKEETPKEYAQRILRGEVDVQ